MSAKPSLPHRAPLRALLIAASLAALPQMAPAIGFDWHANGKAQSAQTQAVALAEARAALYQWGVIYGTSSWVCSPAGFGRRSSCFAR